MGCATYSPAFWYVVARAPPTRSHPWLLRSTRRRPGTLQRPICVRDERGVRRVDKRGDRADRARASASGARKFAPCRTADLSDASSWCGPLRPDSGLVRAGRSIGPNEPVGHDS